MKTAAGKAEAIKRTDSMRAFLQQLGLEIVNLAHIVTLVDIVNHASIVTVVCQHRGRFSP
jgi:hypothetical protein